MQDPCTLNCGHSVCLHKCAKPWVDDQSSCPVCRKELDQDDLSINISLRDAIEAYLHSSEDKICDFCDDDSAVSFCNECMIHLCQTCSDTLHKGKAFRLHTVVPLAVALPPQKCEKHPTEVLKYYCGLCDVVLCTTCCILDGHGKHPESLQTVEAKNNEIATLIARFCEEVDELNGKARTMGIDITTVIAKASEEFRSAFTKATQFCTQVAKTQREKSKTLDFSLTSIELTDELVDDLLAARDGFTKEARNFIQNSGVLIDRLITLTHQSKIRPKKASQHTLPLSLSEVGKFLSGKDLQLWVDILECCDELSTPYPEDQYLLNSDPHILEEIFEHGESEVKKHWNIRPSVSATHRNCYLRRGCPAIQKFAAVVRRHGVECLKENIVFGWFGTHPNWVPLITYEGFNPNNRTAQPLGPGEVFASMENPEAAKHYCVSHNSNVVMVVAILDLDGVCKKKQGYLVVNNPIDFSSSYSLPLLLLRLKSPCSSWEPLWCRIGFSPVEWEHLSSDSVSEDLFLTEESSDDSAQFAEVSDSE